MKSKIRLLLIGKKSFISNIIYLFLKKKIKIKKISYEDFKKYNYLDLKIILIFAIVQLKKISKK